MKVYKIITIVLSSIGGAIELINAVLLEAAFCNIETGLNFNFQVLIKNKFFIIVGIITLGQVIIFLLVQAVIKKQEETTDKMIEEAYNNAIKDLVEQSVELIKNKDYKSANQVLKIIKKIRRERKK